MNVERWQMPSGRIATIDLRQAPEAVDGARALLRDHGGAVQIQEEAPGAGGNQPEGKSDSATKDEPIMNQNTTTPEHDATDVAATFAQIDALPAGHVLVLEPSDSLYRPIEDSFVKPIEWLGEDADESTWVHTACLVGVDGRRARVPDIDGWWDEHVREIPMVAYKHWQRTPNAVIRICHLLAISLGEKVQELKRRQVVETEKWIEQHHDELVAASPADGFEVEVWDQIGPDDVGIMYEREIGPVVVSWPAEYDGQQVKLMQDRPEALVHVGNVSDIVPTTAAMRELAASLIEAADFIDKVCA